MRGRSPPPSRRWRSDEHHRHRRWHHQPDHGARCAAADGHDVTVLDEAAQAGVGTSKANGAQLSQLRRAADPSVLGKLPGWLTRRDVPLRLRLRADPAQWRWALSFLAACRRDTAARDPPSCCSWACTATGARAGASGASSAASAPAAAGLSGRGRLPCRRARFRQASLGCEQHALGRDECLALEPARGDIGQRVVGGVCAQRGRGRLRRCARPWRAGWARGCGWARACGGCACAAARSRRWKPARARCRPTRYVCGQWRGARRRCAARRPAAADLPAQGLQPDLCAGTGQPRAAPV